MDDGSRRSLVKIRTENQDCSSHSFTEIRQQICETLPGLTNLYLSYNIQHEFMIHSALYQYVTLWWWCIDGENVYLLHLWSHIVSWAFLNASTYLSNVSDHIWPQYSHLLITISSKATYHANNLKLVSWIWQRVHWTSVAL